MPRKNLLPGLLLFTLAPFFRLGGQEREEWYRLFLAGKPAGYVHQIVAVSPGGEILTRSLQRLEIRRDRTALELEVELKLWEDQDGAVLRYTLATKMSKLATVVEGKVSGQDLQITTGEPGQARTSTVAYDPKARGPHWLEEAEKRELKRPGDRFAAVAFFPEANRCGQVEVALEKEEAVELPGGKRSLFRRVSRIDILPGTDLFEWVDAEGTVWKVRFKMLGMTIEQARSSREEVLKEKIASPPEIFLTTSVRPDRPLGSSFKSKPVTYRIVLLEGDFKSRKIESSFQAAGQTLVREESPAARVIRIERVLPAKAVPLPVPAAAELRPYLTPNHFIQSDDPEIQAAARKAIGEAKEAFEAAKRLERWVRDHIRKKDLETGFASAKETLQSRAGDCTEHGVLFAALARAAGIPARIATGLVYHDGAFVGHLWTEVYIDRWIPLDATRGAGEVGADHIAMATTSLADATLADVFLELVQILGNLKIDILEP